MPDSDVSVSTPRLSTSPDYVGLVRFLVQPFLESPDSLRIDCETFPRTSRVFIRLAFEGEDKGRVFGRGGRNIQAIRTVVQAAAKAAGHSAHLEIYGSQSVGRDTPAPEGGNKPRSAKAPPRRASRPHS